MKETMLHTPEGVRDIYNNECEKKSAVLNAIHNVMALYGNKDIETPTFEFFEIFNTDAGSVSADMMYKFFDRNNNTLVLRPDFTPSIARSVAKYFKDEELPIRLSYQGKTFINSPQHQGKLSEVTQMGCELVNDDSSAADAEMVACIVDSCKACGLKDFQIEIGEVEYFKGLVEEAGLSDEEEAKVRNFIQIKNFFGLSEYVSTLDIPANVKQAFDELDTLFGGVESLDKAGELANNATSKEAIERLKKVYAALTYYGYEDYVNFDLSNINNYEYYTGIVFSAYTYGTGNPIASGGRYNNLLSQFGKDAPSIGFAILIDELMNAMERQHIDIRKSQKKAMVVYTIEHQSSAVRLASYLRNKGTITQLIRKSKRHPDTEYLTFSEESEIGRVYILQDATTVRIVDSDGCVDEERKLDDLEAVI